MNKLIFCISLIFLCAKLSAQSYQCLQPGQKKYFINSNHYLRGIRIDSVSSDGTTQIYYPYKTIRGNCVGSYPSTYGGSWLGGKVLRKADGTFIFDNMYDDSTIIKTQAVPGDSWTFYSDTSSQYYKATVLSADTMTVFGVVDSIKTIVINAYNGTGIVAGDAANGFQIVLSKNNGFVQIFDLYTFPYHVPGGSSYTYGTDYYYQTCGSQIFDLTNFTNALMTDIYNFSPGDIYEYYFERYGATSMTSDGYRKDSIVATSTVSPTENAITIFRKIWTRNYYPPSQSVDTTTTTEHFFTDLIIDTTVMPEENGIDTMFFYYPEDSSFCSRNDHYGIRGGEVFNTFEPCGTDADYKVGIGDIQYSVCNDPGSDASSSNLKWIYKGGVGCGAFVELPNSVKKVSLNSTIDIYPDPAYDKITIKSTNKIDNVTFSNVMGRTVYSAENVGAKEITIDISGLPQGLYFVNIDGYITKKFVK